MAPDDKSEDAGTAAPPPAAKRAPVPPGPAQAASASESTVEDGDTHEGAGSGTEGGGNDSVDTTGLRDSAPEGSAPEGSAPEGSAPEGSHDRSGVVESVAAPPPGKLPVDDSRIKVYDFHRQETLDRGRLRRIEPVLEVLAHRIAGSLGRSLRSSVRVELKELEQKRWEEFSGALDEITYLSSATVSPTNGRVVLHLPMSFAMALAEIRLGGTGKGPHPERVLTEIEQRLIDELAHAALGELTPAFAPVLNLNLGLITSVSSRMFLQGAAPNDLCLLIGMGVEIGDVGTFDATLCMPLLVLMPILDVLERMDKMEEALVPDETALQVRERLLEAPIDIVVCFPDISLSPEELLSLSPGDVVGLNRQSGSSLILKTGAIPFCEVLPTNRGKRLAALVVAGDEGR